MGYPIEPAFHVEPEIYEFFETATGWGKEEHTKWAKRLENAGEDQRELWHQLHSSGPGRVERPRIRRW